VGNWHPIDAVIHPPTSDPDPDLWGDDRPSTVLRWEDAMPIWHSQSRCRSIQDWDTVYFGESPEDETRSSISTHRFRQAQATCAECPVIAECARHAITKPEDFGIWAGTQPKMREKARDLIDSGIITLEEAIEVICEGAVQTFKELADALGSGLKDVI
jgi:WhiB family redox-sensing transcriptional regulator